MAKGLKYIFFFILVFISAFSCSHKQENTVVSIDGITGIKKEVQIENIGSGGGFSGTAPRLTKRVITKYNAKDEIIYSSHKNIERNGCLISTVKWDVISYGTNGIYKFFLTNGITVTTQTLDINNKLLSQTKTRLSQFEKPVWFDNEEMK